MPLLTRENLAKASLVYYFYPLVKTEAMKGSMAPPSFLSIFTDFCDFRTILKSP
jgi:hypothetical protein